MTASAATPLNRQQILGFWAAWFGWMLDGMDSVIYALVLSPAMKERLFQAGSEDAVVSRALTGKPCRILKSGYTEAWDQAGAPKPLTFPLQSILAGEPLRRAERANKLDYWTYAIGQIVGEMKSETTVRQVFADLLTEYVAATEHLQALTAES